MGNTKYRYCAYGFPIVSEFSIPGLYEARETDGNILRVKIGKVPKTLETPEEVKPLTQISIDEFLFQFPNIVNIYVKGGVEMTIEPLCPNMDEVLLYFYSNGLAAALYQRDKIPFHMSGVITPKGKVWLVAGAKRSGKSTTMLGLLDLGYLFFTDDTVLFEKREETWYTIPSYPMTKQWKRSIEQSSLFDISNGRKVTPRNDLEKYVFDVSPLADPTERQIGGILILNVNGTQVNIKEISPAKKMTELAKNIYRKQWIKGMSKGTLQFDIVNQMAGNVPIYMAIRPKNEDSFSSFAKAIDQFIRSHE